MSTPLEPTPRTRVRQRSNRGVYDREALYAIVDEALICHVGFTLDAQPYVIPTIHARLGDALYLHGAVASRMCRTLGAGVPVCVTVTLLDGLVLARSAFHHSMNYRSAVVLGVAAEVVDLDEKRAALEALVDHVVAGRSQDTRAPTEAELRATAVLRLPIEEASVKVRTGPPVDDAEDYALPYWAGEIPLALTAAAPRPDPRIAEGVPVPETIAAYRARSSLRPGR